MRLGVLLLVAVTLAGCLPRGLERVDSGVPLPAAPLAAELEAHNRVPRAVRVQGRLRVEGKGSAVFGGAADIDQGLRLDVVSGPFSRPLLSVACRAGESCQAYLPSRKVVLSQPCCGAEKWLLALSRGRVPTLGAPSVAWQLEDGSRVLQLVGDAGWVEEVEFPPGDGRPRRAVFSRAGEPELEVLLTEYREVEGQPFPHAIRVRSAEEDRIYGFEFLQVLMVDGIAPAAFHLDVPPGTAVETDEGNGNWSTMVLPPWATVTGQ